MKIFRIKKASVVPTSLKEALDDCLVPNSERGKEYVYKRYYGYIMAVTIRYVRHEMEAEEITNECFVKAFNKLETFKRHEDEDILEKTFRSWIARIAVNASIDFMRAQKNVTMLDDASQKDLLLHAVNNKQQLDMKDILNLLNKLSDIQKAIFNLYEIEGYSHEEIGEKLNIPESTSRTYLARAKQKLRKLYKVYFAESSNVDF